MSDDRKIVAVEFFEGLDDMLIALEVLRDEVREDNWVAISVESAGFALMGWAALTKIAADDGDLYTIEISDKQVEVTP